jgi:Meiotically up-regulated gene 113
MTYLILDKSTKLYKIGKTKNIKKRLSTLSTSNLNLELILTTELEEKLLHRIFKHKRVQKEWFIISEDDIYSIIELEREK